MSKAVHTAQQYWDDRSDLFGNYYVKPTLFDKVFRKAVYTRVAVAAKTVQEFDHPTVLDIGSGPGVNSVTFMKNSNATHLTGIDFAPSMIDYSRNFTKKEGVGDKCTFIDGDFLVHDFRSDTFDVAAALGVFDYIEDAKAFIKKMDAVTTKAFVISWPENGLRMALRRMRYTCPVYHYDEPTIRELHASCNIRDLKFVTTDGGWVTVAYK